MSAFAESLSTAVGLVRDADPQLTRVVVMLVLAREIGRASCRESV